uniref:PID domain-containing protein n=1 Tax=Timema shepardi TaxID=629360 RepID=A0A7R9B1E3_TIMSH|nr:unnamed protein product [Timema shepardi]
MVQRDEMSSRLLSSSGGTVTVTISPSDHRGDHNSVIQTSKSTRVPYMFRLQDFSEVGSTSGKVRPESVTSASVYSTYKQRIDSMFDETRSLMSSCSGVGETFRLDCGYKNSPINFTCAWNDRAERTQMAINNAVQEKIEKMFEEIASTEGSEMESKRHSYYSLSSQNSVSTSCSQTFPVDYLGSVPIVDKVKSLHELQEPLKKLYFGYSPAYYNRNTGGRGTLQISNCGLRMNYLDVNSGEMEQLNPFSTIAVWAALKFVCRSEAVIKDGISAVKQYAFLPLIADPGDKGSLFKRLTEGEEAVMQSNHSLNPLHYHSPIFVVVMKNLGSSHQLKCHGFLCACSEDAIVIAANLYKAVLTSKQIGQWHDVKNSKQRYPSNKNGVSYVSIGDSTHSEDNIDSYAYSDIRSNKSSKNGLQEPIQITNILNVTDIKGSRQPTSTKNQEDGSNLSIIGNRAFVAGMRPDIPVRPPRRIKRSSVSSVDKNYKDIDSVENFCDSTGRKALAHNYSSDETCFRDNTSQDSGNVELITTTQSPVKHPKSDCRNHNSAQVATNHPSEGDILTKIVIPHSRSFLNAGGPFLRYSRHKKNRECYSNSSDGTRSSPLGFNELFTEFRIQEGINSIDDILDAIINAEGMSFNDLKPIYKEFLLKLAVTLTKDELYQRSKSIMRRQKHKMNGSKNSSKAKTNSSTKECGLKHAFRRSILKLSPAKIRLKHSELTYFLTPESSARSNQKTKYYEPVEGMTSMSSRSTRTLSINRRLNRKVLGSYRTRFSKQPSMRRRYRNKESSRFISKQGDTSEDSDFFSTARSPVETKNRPRSDVLHNNEGLNRSSSGYLTCSECSYSSESCTCSSAEKCYCTLGVAKNKMIGDKVTSNYADNKRSLFSCACDIDSCFPSDKCSCPTTRDHRKHTHSKTKLFEGKVSDPKAVAKSKIIHGDAVKISSLGSAFEQLKQRGFVASESSLSREDSPPLPWTKKARLRNSSRKNDSPGSVKSSKSLEFLQINALNYPHPLSVGQDSGNIGSRFTKRMDVYDELNNPYSQSFSPQTKVPRQKRLTHSFDNLTLDYDIDSVPPYPNTHKKVFIVSAQDPKGRVMYMGTQSRRNSHYRYKDNMSLPDAIGIRPKRSYLCNEQKNSPLCQVPQHNKSAEIAALFSDVDICKKVERPRSKSVDEINKVDVLYDSVHFSKYSHLSGKNNVLGSSLEESLGYLP